MILIDKTSKENFLNSFGFFSINESEELDTALTCM